MRWMAALAFFLVQNQGLAQVAVCPLDGDVEGAVRQAIVDVLTLSGGRILSFEGVEKAVAKSADGNGFSLENLLLLSRSLSAETIVWGRVEEYSNLSLSIKGSVEGWKLRLYRFDQNSRTIEAYSKLVAGIPRERALKGLIDYWGSKFWSKNPDMEDAEIAYLGAGKNSPDEPSSSFMSDRGQKIKRDVDRDSQAGQDKEMFGFIIFKPPLKNKKRWTVFDSLSADYRQMIRPSELYPVATATIPPGWPHYEGKLRVALRSGQPESIPSVSPRMKVASYYPGPEQGIKLYRDQADNYYLIADRNAVVDFTYHVGGEPQYEDGRLPDDVEFINLAAEQCASLPVTVREKAAMAVETMGLEKKESPAIIVQDLVAYYNSFDANKEIPQDEPDTYLAITLSKAGVCRHRAFSFFITATFLGIPARIVENEIHAFVEVNLSNSGWHRLDLGGGAARVNYSQGTDVVVEEAVLSQVGVEKAGGKDVGERRGIGKLAEAIIVGIMAIQGGDPNRWLVLVGTGIGLVLMIYLIQRWPRSHRAAMVETPDREIELESREYTTFQIHVEVIRTFEATLVQAMRSYPPGTTYREFVFHAGQKYPTVSSALEEALRIYERIRYGGGEVTQQISQRLAELLNSVQKVLAVSHEQSDTSAGKEL